ncbi:MAG: 50S ribosomal protein L3 [bacterium]|nr:50S ribosomal protein L3 [bacterium]
MKALITRKVGMTSLITDDGVVTAVTLLSASPCVVTQVKTADIDGYQAVQIGTESAKKAHKAQVGHTAKAKLAPSKIVREIRTSELPEDLSVGTELKADVFNVGDEVQVTGTSKGKGFAGTIKRHNFKRGRKTHGGRNYRRPGSIGSMYPQRIFKGKRMAGQMGVDQVTVKGLRIALVDADNNLIAVTGAVPGPKKSIVVLKGVN